MYQTLMAAILGVMLFPQLMTPTDSRSLADNGSENIVMVPERDYSSESVGVVVTAPAVGVLDIRSQQWLYMENIDRSLPVASITKLMTVLVLLEQTPVDWQQIVTMDEKDEVYKPKYVYRGERFTFRDLFYVGLIASDNNAIKALVRSSGLSDEEFVRMMNQKALALGMTESHFVDPTGLEPDNVASVRDIVRLANAAWSHPEASDASGRNDYTITEQTSRRQRRVITTNKLLDSYLQVETGKTGYLDEAGYCLVSKIANAAGREIMVVVLGSQEELDRFQDTKALAWWVFGNYRWP